MILLAKLPIPVPFSVLLSATVGLADVLQQTPRAVTDAAPSNVTLPPEPAVEVVIEDAGVVVTVETDGHTPV